MKKNIKKVIFFLWNYIAYVNNIIFLVKNYIYIKKYIKKLNIKNIKIYKFRDWHNGYSYFIGYKNNIKLFIKVDTKLLLLINEVTAYDNLKHILKENLIKIEDYSENKNIQIIVYEFTTITELSESIILGNINIIDDVFSIISKINSLGIIHRDIKLDNFLYVNEKVKIIDFSFAYTLDNKIKFKELDIHLSNNYSVLKYLGHQLNPKDFEWNDFYSFISILKSIKTTNNNIKNKLTFSIESSNKMINGNTYRINFRKDI
jgi:serine/threonine protein kinase